MCEVIEQEIPEIKLIRPRKFEDNRGYFSEIYKSQYLKDSAVDFAPIQDNLSLSVYQHTLRGLHLQLPPYAQAKLVSCINGSILDVAVDVRKNSPTYGQYVKVKLMADKPEWLFIPAGFAHGFLTLEENTKVLYKVDNPYSKEHEIGIKWDDKLLNIDWEIKNLQPVLSEKDANNILFSSFQGF